MKFSIKEIRVKTGYTQTEVANMLGMTLGNYQKYEYGKIRTYPHEMIAKLCKIFECQPNDLFLLEVETLA
jgi:putative transcriptional regulator